MKNTKAFNPGRIFLVIMSMVLLIASMAVLVSLASCTQETPHEHTFSAEWTSDATYHWHAATCEHTDEVSDKAEHTWDEGKVINPGSCTEPGTMEYTCTVCGATKTESVPELGHSWNEGEITTDPEFMKDGEKTYTCSLCGGTKTEVVSLAAGTEEDPYLITSEADWNVFADYTQENTCEGMYFKLTADFSTSRMAAGNIETKTPFRGKLDGDGHTITMTLDSSVIAGGTATGTGSNWDKGLALFLLAGDGCEIRNLHVTGTITSSRVAPAGFIAWTDQGTSEAKIKIVLENCRSSVRIESSYTTSLWAAGFVGVQHHYSDLTIKDCIFDGSIIAENATLVAGILGYRYDDSITTISGCAVVPGSDTSDRFIKIEKSTAKARTFCNGMVIGLTISDNCLYTSAMCRTNYGAPASLTQGGYFTEERTICGVTLYAAALPGSGTEADPYVISSDDDWNMLCAISNQNSFEGKYIDVRSDIGSEKPVYYMVATNPLTYPFRGKLNGNGHTITVGFDDYSNLYNTSVEATVGFAPIQSVGDGCEIRNVKFAGSFQTSQKLGSGIVAYVIAGTEESHTRVLLENCRSGISIKSTVSGDATTAGMVAVARENVDLTIKNSLFNGKFISSSGTNFSGIVGYQHKGGTLSISDCAVILGEGTSARLETEAKSVTFARYDSSVVPVITGCLYTTVLGNQDVESANQAYLSQEEVEALPELVCGVMKTAEIAGQTLYYVTDLNHNYNEGEITSEPGFMRNGIKTYTCTTCGTTREEITEDRGNGTKENPYLITSEADWNAFVDATDGNTSANAFSGKYFKLTADISVSRMASAYIDASSFTAFRGKFDGDGHTITLTLDSSVFAGGTQSYNKGLALFMTASSGCEIRNLHVTGTITTDRPYAAGFITYVNGASSGTNYAVVIENCRSSVKIISSVTGDATSAGFVAIARTRLNLTLKNCVFDGAFVSENGENFSGLVGYQHNNTASNSILTISDCAVIPGNETSERLKTEAGSRTFLRGDNTLVPVFEGNVLYTSVLGNQDAGEAASLAYLSQTDAAAAAVEAGKAVGTKEICGQTLYYLAESAE